jgi:murein DD-endopeptidase MepM/ murein hydrolase activator NlpD
LNKLNKRNFNIKRKDFFNKKLAFQVSFSIILVACVIVAKEFDSSLSSQIIGVTEEKIENDLSFASIKENFFDLTGSVKSNIPFIGKGIGYASPVSGTISQEYGLSKSGETSYYNHGIDIVSNTQSVKSIGNGKVAFIGSNDKLNNYVVIEDEEKQIIYGKISEAFVKEGDNISKGDIIGSLNDEEKLLHLEIWENGESINPSKLFEIND